MKRTRSHLIKKLVLPIADKAMKTAIASSYQEIKKMQKLSSEEIMNWQNQYLRLLVEHVYKRTKYYKSLFDRLLIKPEDIQTAKDLGKLPKLTKQDVLLHFNELVPDNIHKIPHKNSSTGGSSGDPMPYLLDNRSWSFSNANAIFNWEKISYHYGEKFIALGSSSLFVDRKPSLKHRLYYMLKKKIGLNGVNMSEEVCRNYADLIKREKVRFVYGYASAIYLLAKWVVENHEKLNIAGCFTTSEVLTKQYRQTIEEAFHCNILDCYGANDGGVTAFAHEEGFFQVGYNCIVRINTPDNNGVGPALLTDLYNYAIPLINYELGDEIMINENKNKDYPYNGQIINQVLGRTSDIIILENGNTLTGPGFTILFKDLPVEHYSIKKVGINTIECSVVKLSDFSQCHEDIIRTTFNKQMGSNSYINIKYTTEIPLTKSGKRQYFTS